MDPLRSAKRTVTCLRSPSRELSLKSVSTRGLASRSGSSAVPHWLQKLDLIGGRAPHTGQSFTSTLPHPKHTSEPGGLSCRQTGHAMSGPSGGSIVRPEDVCTCSCVRALGGGGPQ